MKIKATFMLALLIVALIYMSATVKYDDVVGGASAGNDKCEDDHTCYIAYHVDQPNQKDQCRHNENSQWKFYQPLQECGGDPSPIDTKEFVPTKDGSKNTETPAPSLPTDTAVIPPTATQSNPNEDPGPRPTETQPPLFGYRTPTPSATMTPIVVSTQEQEDDCDLCRIMETIGAGVATMAADASKGD